MKNLFPKLVLLLFLAGAFPVFAQHDFSSQTTLGYSTPEYTKPGYNLLEAENGTVNSSDTSPRKGKILMVLSPQQYQEEELNVPRDYFQSRGYSVVLASKGVKTATGMNGESVPVDLNLKEVDLSDYVAVVFVGGEGIYSLRLNEDPDYQALAKSTSAQKKLMGAICLAPWILADAGLLNGKRATASETDHIKSKGAIVSDEAVVQDGNIITGNAPEMLPRANFPIQIFNDFYLRVGGE
jgi:protease I